MGCVHEGGSTIAETQEDCLRTVSAIMRPVLWVYFANASSFIDSEGTTYSMFRVERSDIVNRLYTPRQCVLDDVDDGTRETPPQARLTLRNTPMNEFGAQKLYIIQLTERNPIGARDTSKSIKLTRATIVRTDDHRYDPSRKEWSILI